MAVRAGEKRSVELLFKKVEFQFLQDKKFLETTWHHSVKIHDTAELHT